MSSAELDHFVNPLALVLLGHLPVVEGFFLLRDLILILLKTLCIVGRQVIQFSLDLRILLRLMCFELFSLLALTLFIRIQGLLAPARVLQQVVDGGAGGVESHQDRSALDLWWQLADALAVEHFDDFVDAIARTRAENTGCVVNVVVGKKIAAGSLELVPRQVRSVYSQKPPYG